ncbi:MAG: GerMN domain-containing protein, partial [Anaerolineaceae bacterium]|nr:GerMN domain-containing protein [Anaerolineaceae bacterium]
GCDDSLIPVEVTIRSDLTSPWSALSALLNLDETYYGESGLYNALHQSDLEIQSYETLEGKAKVYLEGELMLGDVCDTPRVEEQILATILQDGQIKEVEVYINGMILQDVLSLK